MKRLFDAATGSLANPLWVFLVFIVAYSAIFAIAGDVTVKKGGLGIDGTRYARITSSLSFDFDALAKKVKDSSAKRFLPSLGARVLLEIVGADTSDSNIIAAFRVFNTIMLMIGALALAGLLGVLGASNGQAWVAFAGIFISPYFAYHQGYPVHTDQAAMSLSLCMLYAYLARYRVLLVVLTLIGYVTHPALPLMGLVLLAFPVENRSPDLSAGHRVPWLPVLLGSLVVGAALFAVYYGFGLDSGEVARAFHKARFASRDFSFSSNWPQILVALGLVSFATVGLSVRRDYFRPAFWLRTLDWKIVLTTVVVLLVLSKGIVEPIFGPDNFKPTPFFLLFKLLHTLRGDVPFEHTAGFLEFYGIGLVLAISVWYDTGRMMSRIGGGLSLLVLIIVWMYLMITARQFAVFFPVIVTFAAMRTIHMPKWFPALFVLLAIATSSLWTLNHKSARVGVPIHVAILALFLLLRYREPIQAGMRRAWATVHPAG